MAIVHDATVSGVGEEIWTADFNITHMRAVVTVAAGAEAMDLTPPSRYLHLGWWAPVENFVSDPDYADGLCLYDPTWLYALFQVRVFPSEFTASGIDGFHYDLADGVSVRFVWYD